MMVFSSLFSALIAVGSYISIPLGAVPIVLQDMFVLLAGLLLGKKWGTASVGVFLFAGLCGIPVFAGGTGGLGKILGPTGGFLIGYIPTVFLTAFISEKLKEGVWQDAIAMFCGLIVLFMCGLPWLKFTLGYSISKTLAIGLSPFILVSVLKIISAVTIVKAIRVYMPTFSGITETREF